MRFLFVEMQQARFKWEETSVNGEIRRECYRQLWKRSGLAREGRIVSVAFGARGVESGGVRTMEGRVCSKAGGQVRVGDKELAECYSVGFAFVEKLLAGLLVNSLVGDEDSAKSLFEARAQCVGSRVFAGSDERQRR